MLQILDGRSMLWPVGTCGGTCPCTFENYVCFLHFMDFFFSQTFTYIFSLLCSLFLIYIFLLIHFFIYFSFLFCFLNWLVSKSLNRYPFQLCSWFVITKWFNNLKFHVLIYFSRHETYGTDRQLGAASVQTVDHGGPAMTFWSL